MRGGDAARDGQPQPGTFRRRPTFAAARPEVRLEHALEQRRVRQARPAIPNHDAQRAAVLVDVDQVLHREQAASDYLAFYQQHLARVQQVVGAIPEAQRPKVFIDMLAGVWDAGCCHTAGKGNFGEFISAAGGRNIAADLLPGVLGDLSMEQIIASRPDVYIATGSRTKPGLASLRVGEQTGEQDARASLAQLVARPGFDTIKAIHEGRVHGIAHDYYDSPYNIIAIEAFAKWFYPDHFKALDVKATQAELYRRFLAVPVTGTEWVDTPLPAAGQQAAR